MTTRVKIRHDEEGSAKLVSVGVVTVGNTNAPDDVRTLKAGEETTVHLYGGQLVFVEETESKEL